MLRTHVSVFSGHRETFPMITQKQLVVTSELPAQYNSTIIASKEIFPTFLR